MRTPARTIGATVGAALLVVLAAAASAQEAAAPAEDPLAKAREYFTRGQELADAKDFKGAAAEFKEAYKLSKRPLLLYNLGFVHDQMGDRALALHYYKKFITDAPDDDKSHQKLLDANERMKTLKKELAAEEWDATSGTAKPPTEPPPADEAVAKPTVSELTHTVVEDAPPGMPIDVVARIPDDAAWRVTLYYRATDEDEFRTARMTAHYADLVGRIPADAVRGSAVHYYLEVKDKAGKLVATSGRAASPNIVYLDAAAKPHFYAELAEHGGGPVNERPGGGPTEERPSYLKWGTTAGAGVLLATAMVCYLLAAQNATELEGQAFDSTEQCPNGQAPPCGFFAGPQKELERKGQLYETVTDVSLAVGLVAAVGAGYFWYTDAKAGRRGGPSGRPSEARAGGGLVAVPFVTGEAVGAAAILSF